MARRVLVLDLGTHTLRAAFLESSLRQGRGIQLLQSQRDPRQPLAEQLHELCAEHLSPDTHVVSCLPGDVACLRLMSLPFSRPQQIAQVIPFELENVLPFSLEDVVVDFQIVEQTTPGVRVLAAAIPNEVVSEHLQALADAQLDPVTVRFAPLQPLACLQLSQHDLSGTVGVLDIGQTRTSITVLRDGALCGVRTLRTGLGQAGGFPAFLQELRWTLLALCQTEEEERFELPSRFFLSGGGACLSQLHAELARAFAADIVPFQQLDLAIQTDLYDFDKQEQGLFATCLGLGLPEVLGKAEDGLNFRRGAFAYQGQRVALQHEWSRLGWLAASVGVAAGLAFGVDLYRLDTRYDLLRSEIRQVFSDTLPEVRTIVNEKIQLQDAVATLQKRQRMFRGEVMASPLEMLRQLSTAVPEKITLDLDEWVFDGKMVRLRGTTDSFDAAESIKTAAAGLAAFREVQLKDVKAVPGGKKVSFQLHGLVQVEETTS